MEAHLAADAHDVSGLLHGLHQYLGGRTHQCRRAGRARHGQPVRPVPHGRGHVHVQRCHGSGQPIAGSQTYAPCPALCGHHCPWQPAGRYPGGPAGLAAGQPHPAHSPGPGAHPAGHRRFLGYHHAGPARPVCLRRHRCHVPCHPAGPAAALGGGHGLRLRPAGLSGAGPRLVRPALHGLYGHRLGQCRCPVSGSRGQLFAALPCRLPVPPGHAHHSLAAGRSSLPAQGGPARGRGPDRLAVRLPHAFRPGGLPAL